MKIEGERGREMQWSSILMYYQQCLGTSWSRFWKRSPGWWTFQQGLERRPRSRTEHHSLLHWSSQGRWQGHPELERQVDRNGLPRAHPRCLRCRPDHRHWKVSPALEAALLLITITNLRTDFLSAGLVVEWDKCGSEGQEDLGSNPTNELKLNLAGFYLGLLKNLIVG